jgi:hypothetical protein
MEIFSELKDDLRKKVVSSWQSISESEKDHFINQISLALIVWGSDDVGKKILVKAIENQFSDGSENLADFGLYVGSLLRNNDVSDRKDKVHRAKGIIENYRMKNALPSEPHKDIGI